MAITRNTRDTRDGSHYYSSTKARASEAHSNMLCRLKERILGSGIQHEVINRYRGYDDEHTQAGMLSGKIEEYSLIIQHHTLNLLSPRGRMRPRPGRQASGFSKLSSSGHTTSTQPSTQDTGSVDSFPTEV